MSTFFTAPHNGINKIDWIFRDGCFDAKGAKNVDAKDAKSLRPLCVKTFAFVALKTPHPKTLRNGEIQA